MKYKILTVTFYILFFTKALPQDVNLELKKGMVVSFIASHFHSPEAKQNAGAYFEKMFPLAQKHSFTPLVQFNTLELQQNHFMASALGIYSWDSQKHFDAFHNEESWPELKSTRPLYWKNLRSVHITIKEDRTLRFYSDKVYRITYIWLHQFENSSENLEKYVSPMRKVIDRLGARYIVTFDSSELKSMSNLNNDRIPDRIAITEWPDIDTHKQYISSPEFKEYSKFFFSAIAEFEAFNTAAIIN